LPQERQSKLEEIRSQYTNLYVKNLDSEVSLEDFQRMFEPYGMITSAVIQSDDDGKNKGFGFVNFETHDEAARAVEALHDKEINGKKLFVARAQKKQEREEELRRSFEAAKMEKLSKWQGVNLYVKNVDDDMDDDKLRAEFEPFGTITSAKIMRDEKGHSKGFGFVCYSSPDEATKAVAEMNNKMIGNKPLYVSLAQRRDVRRQQLENLIAQRNQTRMQQAAAAGISNGYLNAPMYFPPGAGYPPQGSGRGNYGFPPNMMGRSGYRGPQVPGMPPMPGYGGPQGYAMPSYSGGAPPRGPPGPPRGNAPNATNGANPAARAPTAAAPAAGGTPGAASRAPLPPATGTAAAPKQAIQIPGLLSHPPEQQKQMIGEHIYVRVFE
jgi:polyadenylate-binding protein